MSIVVLNLPTVKRKKEERPKKCPNCGRETFQRWGQVNKAVKDTRVRKVKVYRYCCYHCKHTFRHYPAGVSHAQQSERLMKLGVCGEVESHEWLARCAGCRAADPQQTAVETSTDRRCRWGLGQW